MLCSCSDKSGQGGNSDFYAYYTKIEVNGSGSFSKDDCKQGIIRDTDGTQTLIVWLELESEKPLKIRILK